MSKQCLFALRNIEKILQPFCPTLEFPVFNQNFENVDISTSQEINYLLNDNSISQGSLKRKQNKKNTSTPVGDNIRKDSNISAVNLSESQSVSESFQLSEEEEFTIGSVDESQFLVRPKSNSIEVESDSIYCQTPKRVFAGMVSSSGEDDESIAKRKCVEEHIITTNIGSEQAASNTIESPGATQKGESITDISTAQNESSDLDDAPPVLNGITGTLERMESIEGNNVNESEELDANDTGDSDNEMLKSFVDEVIEVD